MARPQRNTVDYFPHPVTQRRNEADAELIAAAPEMHRLLSEWCDADDTFEVMKARIKVLKLIT